MNYSPHIPALQLSIRAALSAWLALVIAEFLRLQYPIYALISAIVVTDLSPAETKQLGLRRLVGSVLGAVLGAVISEFLPPAPWVLGLGILAAMFLSQLLHLEGAHRIAGYVCGIIVHDHSAHPWSYAFYRLVETLLGVGVALLVSFLPKLIRAESKQQDP